MNEREIFLSALEFRDRTARQAYLQQTCAGDSDLLTGIESLLDLHDRPSQFLNTPAIEQLAMPSDGGPRDSVLRGTSSTAESQSEGSAIQAESLNEQSDKILLGKLEPSLCPDALGRLAHYDILEILGRGAFGTVLKALDVKLQRIVAIKILARKWRRPRRRASGF